MQTFGITGKHGYRFNALLATVQQLWLINQELLRQLSDSDLISELEKAVTEMAKVEQANQEKDKEIELLKSKIRCLEAS